MEKNVKIILAVGIIILAIFLLDNYLGMTGNVGAAPTSSINIRDFWVGGLLDTGTAASPAYVDYSGGDVLDFNVYMEDQVSTEPTCCLRTNTGTGIGTYAYATPCSATEEPTPGPLLPIDEKGFSIAFFCECGEKKITVGCPETRYKDCNDCCGLPN